MSRVMCSILGMGLLLVCASFDVCIGANSENVFTVPGIYEEAELAPVKSVGTRSTGDSGMRRVQLAKAPSLVGKQQFETHLKPSDTFDAVGRLPKIESAPLRYLEIEVSHSSHVFKLLGVSGDKKDIIYECKIGLGSPEFPTPVGTYFVTHIYDDDPWWIPPKDRAWAAGDVPSRKVYGGTMAPLLKKRPVRAKKATQSDFEDQLAGLVQLDDYGYRFHGTNAPRSIGRNQSHGCVRMLSDDARKVANLIKDNVGTVDRKESENGTYVILKAPVRLNLVK